MSDRAKIVEWAQGCYEDFDFTAAQEWLEDNPTKRAAGHLPVYAPKEVMHAAGFLPVGIYGGSDRLEIIKGDAYYQSYICHFPRSVIELAQSGRLDFLSAVLFPSTCDVIRNLSGVWQVLYPDLYVRYLDLPQGKDREMRTAFWKSELLALNEGLASVTGFTAGEEHLRRSIILYNNLRKVVGELYHERSERPWDIPSEELYVLLRAAEVVAPELFVEKAHAYLAAAEKDPGQVKDKSRVIVTGAFCEQPPLGLIKTIERSGCYIVDDDFMLGSRLFTQAVFTDGDPWGNLAYSLVHNAQPTSVLYEPDPGGKKRFLKERVEAVDADGVIMAAPSFCDPALLDRPMLRDGATAAGIPCIAFKYSENTGQFQQFREQAGTFADSIKLWGGV